MDLLLVFIGLILEYPIYLITSKQCFFNNSTKMSFSDKFKLILVSPSNVYIYSLTIYGIILSITKTTFNFVAEYTIILSLFILFMFLYRFIIKTEKRKLACFVYNSFVLIQVTTVETISTNQPLPILILSALVCPVIICIFYYILITKAIKKIDNDIKN